MSKAFIVLAGAALILFVLMIGIALIMMVAEGYSFYW